MSGDKIFPLKVLETTWRARSLKNEFYVQRRAPTKNCSLLRLPSHITSFDITKDGKRIGIADKAGHIYMMDVDSALLVDNIRSPPKVPNLLKIGQDVNSTDKFGNTELYKAVKARECVIVTLLLEAGADLSLNYPTSGGNIFHIVSRAEEANAIIKHAAYHYSVNLIDHLINQKDKFGFTPLNLLLQTYPRSSKLQQLLKVYISSGADTNILAPDLFLGPVVLKSKSTTTSPATLLNICFLWWHRHQYLLEKEGRNLPIEIKEKIIEFQNPNENAIFLGEHSKPFSLQAPTDIFSLNQGCWYQSK